MTKSIFLIGGGKGGVGKAQPTQDPTRRRDVRREDHRH